MSEVCLSEKNGRAVGSGQRAMGNIPRQEGKAKGNRQRPAGSSKGDNYQA